MLTEIISNNGHVKNRYYVLTSNLSIKQKKKWKLIKLLYFFLNFEKYRERKYLLEIVNAHLKQQLNSVSHNINVRTSSS